MAIASMNAPRPNALQTIHISTESLSQARAGILSTKTNTPMSPSDKIFFSPKSAALSSPTATGESRFRTLSLRAQADFGVNETAQGGKSLFTFPKARSLQHKTRRLSLPSAAAAEIAIASISLLSKLPPPKLPLRHVSVFQATTKVLKDKDATRTPTLGNSASMAVLASLTSPSSWSARSRRSQQTFPPQPVSGRVSASTASEPTIVIITPAQPPSVSSAGQRRPSQVLSSLPFEHGVNTAPVASTTVIASSQNQEPKASFISSTKVTSAEPLARTKQLEASRPQAADTSPSAWSIPPSRGFSAEYNGAATEQAQPEEVSAEVPAKSSAAEVTKSSGDAGQAETPPKSSPAEYSTSPAESVGNGEPSAAQEASVQPAETGGPSESSSSKKKDKPKESKGSDKFSGKQKSPDSQPSKTRKPSQKEPIGASKNTDSVSKPVLDPKQSAELSVQSTRPISNQFPLSSSSSSSSSATSAQLTVAVPIPYANTESAQISSEAGHTSQMTSLVSSDRLPSTEEQRSKEKKSKEPSRAKISSPNNSKSVSKALAVADNFASSPESNSRNIKKMVAPTKPAKNGAQSPMPSPSIATNNSKPSVSLTPQSPLDNDSDTITTTNSSSRAPVTTLTSFPERPALASKRSMAVLQAGIAVGEPVGDSKTEATDASGGRTQTKETNSNDAITMPAARKTQPKKEKPIKKEKVVSKKESKSATSKTDVPLSEPTAVEDHDQSDANARTSKVRFDTTVKQGMQEAATEKGVESTEKKVKGTEKGVEYTEKGIEDAEQEVISIDNETANVASPQQSDHLSSSEEEDESDSVEAVSAEPESPDHSLPHDMGRVPQVKQKPDPFYRKLTKLVNKASKSALEGKPLRSNPGSETAAGTGATKTTGHTESVYHSEEEDGWDLQQEVSIDKAAQQVQEQLLNHARSVAYNNALAQREEKLVQNWQKRVDSLTRNNQRKVAAQKIQRMYRRFTPSLSRMNIS